VAVTAERGWNGPATAAQLLRHPVGGEPSMPMFDTVLKRLERASASIVRSVEPAHASARVGDVAFAMESDDRRLRRCAALDYPGERVELLAVDNGRATARGILESYGGRVRTSTRAFPARAPRAIAAWAKRSSGGGVHRADCRPGWLRHLVTPLLDHTACVAGGVPGTDPQPDERFGETLHDHERAMTHFRPPYAIAMSWASRASVSREQGLFDPSFLRGGIPSSRTACSSPVTVWCTCRRRRLPPQPFDAARCSEQGSERRLVGAVRGTPRHARTRRGRFAVRDALLLRSLVHAARQ
jgi:hypothetical protein